jgi:hypothetical protein
VLQLDLKTPRRPGSRDFRFASTSGGV